MFDCSYKYKNQENGIFVVLNYPLLTEPVLYSCNCDENSFNSRVIQFHFARGQNKNGGVAVHNCELKKKQILLATK